MKTKLTIYVEGDFMMKYTNLPIWFLTPKKRRGHICMYIDDEEAKGEPIRM